jgi:hypothetical protein
MLELVYRARKRNNLTGVGQNHGRSALARRKKKFKEWHGLVRGTTDWEPPRMPDDLVNRVRL